MDYNRFSSNFKVYFKIFHGFLALGVTVAWPTPALTGTVAEFAPIGLSGSPPGSL